MRSDSDDRSVPFSRRHFLTGTVAGLAGAALGFPGIPRQALAQLPPAGRCEYLTWAWTPKVQQMLAHRGHRLHHYLWHVIRNSWVNLSEPKRTSLQGLKWAAPRPSLVRPIWDKYKKTKPRWTVGPAGEDFLFFHRWMIALINQWLKQEKPGGEVDSWSRLDTIPAPGAGCPDERVPALIPTFEGKDGSPEVPHSLAVRVREVKSDAYFWSRMIWWENQFKDEAYLAGVRLGELGARLEFSVHNQMHIRWSAMPSNGALLRPEESIDPKWDATGYDTLFDEYSSHVNPIFYRLHKWIDLRIEDWAAAHASHVEPYEESIGNVKFVWYRNKAGGDWIQVAQPWMGGPADIVTLEKAHQILIQKDPKTAEAVDEEPAAGLLLLKDIF